MTKKKEQKVIDPLEEWTDEDELAFQEELWADFLGSLWNSGSWSAICGQLEENYDEGEIIWIDSMYLEQPKS